MTKFWELFEQSVIIQGILAISFSGAIIYLYCTGKEVPQELVALVSLILGYFFGAKTTHAQVQVARAIEDATRKGD